MNNPLMTDDKKVWRAWAKQRREALPAIERQRRSDALLFRLMGHPRFADAQQVMLYGSIGTEVNTWPLIAEVLRTRGHVMLPRIDAVRRSLVFYRVTDLSRELQPPALWGLREPDPDRCDPVSPAQMDFVLVPGLLFDQQGYRLGYGGGFYDRLLSDPTLTAWTLAWAFDVQRVAQLPHEAHDQRVQTCWFDDNKEKFSC